MTVIIPVVDDCNNKLTIADGFNTSKHVCLYDTDQKTFRWMDSTHTINLEGNVVAELNRMNISGVITSHIKMMALRLFKENSIKVYKSEGTELEYNIGLFDNQKLPNYSLFDAIGNGGCDSGCGSCASAATDCKTN